jgi:hypothetical protein
MATARLVIMLASEHVPLKEQSTQKGRPEAHEPRHIVNHAHGPLRHCLAERNAKTKNAATSWTTLMVLQGFAR